MSYKLNNHPPAEWDVKNAAMKLLQEFVFRRIRDMEIQMESVRTNRPQFSTNIGPNVQQLLEGFGTDNTKIVCEFNNYTHEKAVDEALGLLYNADRICSIRPIGSSTNWYIVNDRYVETPIDPVMELLEGNLKLALAVQRLEKLEQIVLKDMLK